MAETRTFYQPVKFNEAVSFLAGAVPVTYGNNVILSLGTGGDAVLVLKSTSTLANTAITSVLIGTPVTPALAADSLIISNTTADGDILIAGNKGGASQAAVFIDVSVPTIDILVAGVRHLRVATAGTTLGLAGTTAGALLLSGVTSGVVTLKTADAAGTWTMKLPAAVGSAGQQLTDTAGDGITAWAAASLGAWKHDLGVLDPDEALAAVVSAPTHRFRYNADVMPAGQWAPPDEMTGIFAEEAPWAMHGQRDGLKSGIAFSPVNAVGYLRAAVEALATRLETLEAR